MSGGVDSERVLGVASRCSTLGILSWVSWVNTGWLDDWVGVVGGVESPEAAEREEEKKKVHDRYHNFSGLSFVNLTYKN